MTPIQAIRDALTDPQTRASRVDEAMSRPAKLYRLGTLDALRGRLEKDQADALDDEMMTLEWELGMGA